MSVPNPNPNTNPNSIIFSHLDCVGTGKKLTFLTYPDYESLANLDFPHLKNPSYLCFHGHIHGIICLSDYDDIYFYNPTTPELHHLPPSILPQVRTGKFFELVSNPSAVGFGYDPKSKDYKAIRVVNYRNYPSRVEIYSLRTNEWREIKLTCVFGSHTMSSSFQMYHEGFYYWWAPILGKEYIQFFDMSNEVFGTIPLPESFDGYTESRSLGVWEGSIVIFHYPDGKTFDIWGMKTIDEEYIWSKLFTACCPVSAINRIFLFVNSDELLIEADGGQVVSYNLKTKELANLHQVKASPDLCFSIEKTQSSIKSGRKEVASCISSD